jgi:hypothetical protein
MSSVIGPGPLFSSVPTLTPPVGLRAQSWTTDRSACKKYTSTKRMMK